MISVNTAVVNNNVQGPCILCVIDFSESSKDALRAALTIADSTASRLTILYPYRLNQPMNVISIADWKRSIEADASNNFNRMATSLVYESKVLWEFKPEVGFVDDRIESFAGKNNVRIIVMAAELARTCDGALLDILDKHQCTLLIVPKNQN